MEAAEETETRRLPVEKHCHFDDDCVWLHRGPTAQVGRFSRNFLNRSIPCTLVLLMPTRRKCGGRRRMRGRGFMDFLGKTNSFLKNSKLISTVGNALADAGVPIAGQIAGVAS